MLHRCGIAGTIARRGARYRCAPLEPRLTNALDGIGSLIAAGRAPDAEAAARALLAQIEKETGPDSLDTARVLHVLVDAARRNSDVRATDIRQLAQRALDIRERRGAPPALIAASVRMLGFVLRSERDPEETKRLYVRALTLLEQAAGEDPSLAPILVDLGDLESGLGNFEDARKSFERALGIYEKAYGSGDPRVAETIRNMAVLSTRTGNTSSAAALYERALAILRKALEPNHPRLRVAFSNVADVHAWAGSALLEEGQDELAVEAFEKAVTAQEGAAFRPRLEVYLRMLAGALAGSGELDRAIQIALESEAVRAEHARAATDGLPERQVAAMVAHRRRSLTVALSLIRDRPAFTSDVWDVIMQSRALALEEASARHRSASGAEDHRRVELRHAFARARQRLASLVVRGPAGAPMAAYREALDRASREKQETEGALVAATVGGRDAEKPDSGSLSEIRAALPPASAIVALVQYNHSEWSRDRAPRLRTIPSYLAFVQRSDTPQPVAVHLGAASTIDALVERWRDHVEQPASAASFGSLRLLASYRAVASELRQRVWDPLRMHLRGARRVFVVPDGTLHLVDFGALPVGQSEYLAERLPAIHYLSAERDLLARTPRVISQGILIVGAPAFDSARGLTAPSTQATAVRPTKALRGRRQVCSLFEGVDFEPLPATAQEAAEVASLWKKVGMVRRPSQSDPRQSVAKGAVTLLSDTGAGEARFKAEAPGKQILHLATHGFFLGGPCPAALDRPASPAAAVARVTVHNPLLLSGLVFAGANQRPSTGPDEEDGILMAEEVAGLDLHGVEWVVLSGCDTGIGHIKAGEGVFGLRRAFQIAGARTVIMSLWQVEDERTRQWMRVLYQRRFAAGRTTADAVRDASLELLRRRRAANASTHPFYWAGFVAAGDWH